MQHTPQPRATRIPAGLIAGAIIVVGLLISGIAFAFWHEWQVFAAESPTVAWLIRFLLFAIPVSLLAGYGWAGLLWIGSRVKVYMRRNEHQYIAMEHTTQQIRAQRSQGLPEAITSLNYHDSHRDLPQIAGPVIEGEVIRTTSIPTFGQLLDTGAIGSGRPLILGYAADSGQPITGDWERLYSCGVGGMTGSGKSWVIAFLAGQSAAAGARIILIDPHAGDPESLSNRLACLSPSFMCDVASTPSAIESALKLASSKLDNRRAGRGGTWPLLLICDEWTSMLRGKLGDLLTATALDYAEQGRKFGCFAILAAQAWQVDAAGEVRDRLASHYILRTRGDQFRYQTGLRSGSTPEDTLTLPPGQAYLLSTRGELQKVTIPTMTHADILRLGTLVDAPARSVPTMGFLAPTQPLSPITASAATSRQHDGDIKATSENHVTTASQSPEAARALALLQEGRDLPAIVAEMRGVKPKEGRKYMTALADVTDLIRQATKGVQG